MKDRKIKSKKLAREEVSRARSWREEGVRESVCERGGEGEEIKKRKKKIRTEELKESEELTQ